jgi:hypothetical protein
MPDYLLDVRHFITLLRLNKFNYLIKKPRTGILYPVSRIMYLLSSFRTQISPKKKKF